MNEQVIALSGGIGGAKLALGLSNVLNADELLVVANTADDFEHLGFHICPDIDTLLYTLAGISNTTTGWGRADEAWSFMETLREDKPDDAWFQLGDKDLETHRYRTQALANGNTLSCVTAKLAYRFRVKPAIVPMSDDPVRTFVRVESDAGNDWLPFQEYFVKHRCEPRTRAIEFRGSTEAAVSPVLQTTVSERKTRVVILCPSNPYLSVDPILAVPGMVELLRACAAPVIAVSPIVGGRAIKGPTAKIMQELGLEADVMAIAAHYQSVIDGLVIDTQDRARLEDVQAMGIPAIATNTIMRSLQDRMQLGRDVLEFARGL